jgi:hypothetical protein
VRTLDEKTGLWRAPTEAEKNSYADVTLPKKLVSYASWIKGTSKTFSSRGTKLRRVDSWLYTYEKNPSKLALTALKQEFAQWKQSKGPGEGWKESGRNANALVTLLDQQLSGYGDRDVLSGDQAFMEQGLIHARLGIVYLFAHTDCDNFFNILVHGIVDVATTAVDYSAAQFTIADKAAGIDPDKDQRIKDLGVASSTPATVLKATDQIDAAVRKKVGNASLRDNASLQLENRTIATPVWLQHTTPPPPSGYLRELWDKLVDKLYRAAEEIYKFVIARCEWAKETLKAKWQDKEGTALQYIPGLLRKLVNFLLSKLIANLAPFIGSGLDLAGGIAKTIVASVDKYKEWAGRQNVQLLAGTPSTIAEAIQRAMWLCVGEGMYDTLKGAGNLAMDFGTVASAGAAAVAKLVIGVVEALGTTIWRLVEVVRMRRCFGQARELWVERARTDALHLRPIEFNRWFKSYALTAPALAMLALNSGICGDKMHFLKMFHDDTQIVTQSQFDAGCVYVDQMKIWGANYISESGFNFVSNDPLTKGLITLAQSHKAVETRKSKALAAVLGFLNG